VSAAGRIAFEGRGLRSLAARGVLVNAVFRVGVVTLSMLKGLAVAAFLTASEYGVWGILLISLLTMLWLKEVGVSDKFVQQSESDQAEAFQKALTLELAASGAFSLLFAAAVPIYAAVYGQPKLVAPGLAMALLPLLGALQAPTWVFWRRMDFVKQRVLGSVDPVLSFVVTIALAVAGAGYWSLVIGALVGAAAGGAAALAASPYPLRLRWEGRSAREYLSFSWPLVIAGGSSLVIAQGALLTGEAVLGLAGAGAITLAATIANYSDRVDEILTATIYPAVCAVVDRTELLFEAFVKSNRLALMWGIPFGVGLSLFAADLVDLVLGDKWRSATLLLQVFGLTAAAGHIGFNWTAFYRAIGKTRPIAVWSFLTMVAFLTAGIPLMIVDGLRGYAIGTAVMTLVSVLVRGYYLQRLFAGFRFFSHALRSLAPTVPAALLVLLVRLIEPGHRTVAMVLVELVAYLAVTVAATVVLERPLIREALGYLRRASDPAPA
jgi:PST family polysaccharide transporter